MGIRIVCPNGHKLNIKSFLAGKRGVCPHCGAKFEIPVGASPSPATDAPAASAGSSGRSSGNHLSTVAGTGAATEQATPARAAPASAAPAAATSPTAAQPSATGAAAVQGVSAQPAAAQPSASPGAAAVQPAVGAVAAPQPAPSAQPQTVVDPLAEAPDALWYIRPPSGGQYGPAKADLIRQWISEGRITADSLVWREGWPDWKLASATFPSMGGGVVQAVAPVAAAQASPGAAPAAVAPVQAVPVQAAAVPSASGPEFPSLGPNASPGRKPTIYRRKNNTARVVAIGFLSVALIVLTALLVYVLYFKPAL